ncbi:MAG: heavy-metal-associated protein, partial [Alphaproteobacteria bacterium]|nr:heavy-metal-associated protein [Alphaproteobacteria bacterium]
MKLLRRFPYLLSLLLAVVVGGAVYAQLEGSDRGIAPIDSASTFEIDGIDVDVTAATGEKAREEGWREAQSKGWKALWAKTHGLPIAQAPDLADSSLNNMVSGIIVEQEQIGPKRYIATLGVLFDRARTGELLGVSGAVRRSAPMLVIPVMLTGSTFTSFEYRNEWQKAWARFRTGGSAVDYVWPVGNGIDPLLLDESQTRRPGRAWWRMLLDQYGAADVIVPEVHLMRTFPGGPVTATFSARHGPDSQLLGQVTLRVQNSAALPRLMDEGIRRLDAIFTQALTAGMLTPDPSLRVPEAPPPPDVTEEAPPELPVDLSPATATPGATTTTTFVVQVETPDAAAVSRAELSVSRVGGVTSAITTSLALGGTSLMRVTYMGDSAAFQAALQAQGWQVSGSGT